MTTATTLQLDLSYLGIPNQEKYEESQFAKTLNARKVVPGQAFWEVEGLCSILVSYLDPSTGYEVLNYYHPNRCAQIFRAVWHKYSFATTDALIDFAKDPMGSILIYTSRFKLETLHISAHRKVAFAILKHQENMPDLTERETVTTYNARYSSLAWSFNIKHKEHL